MWSRIIRRRACMTLRNPSTAAARNQVQRRTLIAAPKPGDGPLMERRPDRELPSITGFRWSRTLPIFFALIAGASVAIFNYQKLSSPVVASTLYALRTNARARAYLGDEIYFRHSIPWIGGEMNQLRGRINIRFAVKGTRGTAVMRFTSFRPTPRGLFETTEWSLETPDGKKIDLLDGHDPFKAQPAFPMDEEEREDAVRGFRQQLK
ncbi:cytochrome oxidase assembly protein 1 [Parahypoxylon ruwenzoriense]